MDRGYREHPESRRQGCNWTIEIKGPMRHTKAHVTVNKYENGKPSEVFVRISKEGSDIQTAYNAWAMTASKALQCGVPVDVLARAVRCIKDDSTGTWGRVPVSSLWDAIGKLLEDL